MKTILYQPIFINPQAYFVFPQLYHIEKGDSYIEPANITGQLIINDLTKSLTSTPILDVESFSNGITYQTKNSYNGTPIKFNATGIKDNSELYIGKLRPTEINGYIGCHSDFLLFNRTLSEDEINWLKENIYNIEI